MKAYLDNVIVCGNVRRDLLPQAEMDAAVALVESAGRGELEIVTSRESWREQDKTKDPVVRAAFQRARPDLAVVPDDHRLLGFHHQQDQFGGFVTYPLLTDVVDETLFTGLTGARLKPGDARHLMFAVHNGCDRFVTLDERDILPVREQLELLCRGLRIVRPTELLAELQAR